MHDVTQVVFLYLSSTSTIASIVLKKDGFFSQNVMKDDPNQDGKITWEEFLKVMG